MNNNEIVQLKSYDDKTGQETGNVLPITNSEAVKVKNNKKLTEILTELDNRIDQTNASLGNIENYEMNKKIFFKEFNNINGITHVMAGIDSLTNGAGQSCWVDYFRNRCFGEFGCGGLGYIGFHNTQVMEFGTWNTNLLSIAGTEYDKYSLDNKGIYFNGTTGDHVYLYLKNKNFKYMKLIYLKQPNGGNFQIRWANDQPSSRVTVDTNSTDYDLGVYELPNQNNKDRDGTIDIRSFVGNVVLFGVYCYNDNGVIVTKLGKGGDKFVDHSNTLDTFREKWLDILKPDYYLFNGGTNDNMVLKPYEYKERLEKYIRSFLNKHCKVVLIAPNLMETTDKSYQLEYENILEDYAKLNNCSFIRHAETLGTYQNALARGWMLDGVHPGIIGNRRLSSLHLQNFGVPLLGGVDNGSIIWDENSNHANDTIKHDLQIKKFNNISEKIQIYSIGLSNGYPNGLVEINVLLNPYSNKSIIKRKHYFSISNDTGKGKLIVFHQFMQ